MTQIVLYQLMTVLKRNNKSFWKSLHMKTLLNPADSIKVPSPCRIANSWQLFLQLIKVFAHSPLPCSSHIQEIYSRTKSQNLLFGICSMAKSWIKSPQMIELYPNNQLRKLHDALFLCIEEYCLMPYLKNFRSVFCKSYLGTEAMQTDKTKQNLTNNLLKACKYSNCQFLWTNS